MLKNILLISLLINVFCCTNEKVDKNFSGNFEKIEIGMEKSKVLKLLGEPPKVIEYKQDKSKIIRFVYNPKSKFSSTIPYIEFEFSTQKVIKVVKEE